MGGKSALTLSMQRAHMNPISQNALEHSINAILKRLDISIVCQTDVTLKIVVLKRNNICCTYANAFSASNIRKSKSVSQKSINKTFIPREK
jgi:hypothetical protein